MPSGIYVIKNTVNDKKYVGSAVDCLKRRNRHLHDLRKNKHHNRYLQREFNKYEEKNFKFEIIYECCKLDLVEKEQYYLDKLQPEYNFEKTAYRSVGVKRSKETCQKLSERLFTKKWRENIRKGHLGKKHSEETKRKMSERHKGKIRTKEHCMNLSRSLKGKTSPNRGKKLGPLSEETKLKISRSLKGREVWNKGIKTGPQSEETRRKKREARLKYLANIKFEE